MKLNLHIYDTTILLVDDNESNIIFIKALLKDAGYHHIYSASCAIDAYEILESEEIDIILMDIHMPEIDGLEATQAIKSNAKYAHIPIIMVTADDEDTSLKKSFDLGASDFITKPINKVALLSRLHNVLSYQAKDALLMQHSRFDAMEEVIAMLAHQWRQPLGAINAIISALLTQKELKDLSDEELISSLNKVNLYSNELSDMITTFREFFNSDIPAKIGSPNEAIYEVKRLMNESLKQKGLELHLDLGELKEVSYVQNLLVQVLTNIVTNAKEAYERNQMDQQRITIRSFMQNEKINIIIKDSAGGIDTRLKQSIFEPYVSSKNERNGKGLGLYISKSIIKQQFNGNIYASSKGDKSEFLISF